MPKALKETHWSVVKFLQAISLATAIIINITTHSQVNLFQPSLSRLTADFIMAARGFLPKIFPDAKTPAIIIDTMVGLILIKNSSSKNIVSPPKKTTDTHPALLKVTKSGVLSRHRHPNAVHGFVLKGRWHYLEHDWVAETGSYVFEPPGETHTLVVPEGVDEMITFFQVNGMMLYVDPWGKVQGYEDVFSKIDLCKKHFAAAGLGEDFVNQFIR